MNSNNLLNAINSSDLTIFLNNENNKISDLIKNEKDLSKTLKKCNHRIIDYSPDMDPSERIEIYNNLIKEITNIKK